MMKTIGSLVMEAEELGETLSRISFYDFMSNALPNC